MILAIKLKTQWSKCYEKRKETKPWTRIKERGCVRWSLPPPACVNISSLKCATNARPLLSHRITRLKQKATRCVARTCTRTHRPTHSWETPVNWGATVIYILPLNKQRPARGSPGGLAASWPSTVSQSRLPPRARTRPLLPPLLSRCYRMRHSLFIRLFCSLPCLSMKSRLIFLGFASGLFLLFWHTALTSLLKEECVFISTFCVFPPYIICSVGEVSEILFVFSFFLIPWIQVFRRALLLFLFLSVPLELTTSARLLSVEIFHQCVLSPSFLFSRCRSDLITSMPFFKKEGPHWSKQVSSRSRISAQCRTKPQHSERGNNKISSVGKMQQGY